MASHEGHYAGVVHYLPFGQSICPALGVPCQVWPGDGRNTYEYQRRVLETEATSCQYSSSRASSQIFLRDKRYMLHRNAHEGRAWRIRPHRHSPPCPSGPFRRVSRLCTRPFLFANASIKQNRMQIEMSNALCAGRRCAKKSTKRKKCLANDDLVSTSILAFPRVADRVKRTPNQVRKFIRVLTHSPASQKSNEQKKGQGGKGGP